jgi:hypothetical protein
MITSTMPLVQATVADTSTDGWRFIALIAITLLTIVILGLIFRPSTRRPEAITCEAGPNGDEGVTKATAGPFGAAAPESVLPPVEPAPADSALAAQRLKQIVSRVTTREPAGPGKLDQLRRGDRDVTPPEEADVERQDGDAGMNVSEQGTISDHDADQAGLDAAAFEEQINRLFGIREETGKIVPFTPRKSPPGEQERRAGDQAGRHIEAPRAPGQERPLTQFPVDMTTREGITSTIQELLFCANVGELLHGFALYTDRYLFQFLDDSRMSEEEFREAYSDIPAKDPADWTRIDALSDFQRLQDGRVSVQVRYIDGAEVDGAERFIMRFDAHLDRWLIDDIQAI